MSDDEMLEFEDNQLKSEGYSSVDESSFDACIKVGYHLFPIHRRVLVASTVYFQEMFDHSWIENHENIINIKDIEPCAMEEIINYAYTGKINITNENLLSLWIAFDYFLLFNFRDECVNILIEKLKEQIIAGIHIQSNPIFSKIIEIRSYADPMDSVRLVSICDHYIGYHFPQLLSSNEFLHLNFNQLISLIQSDDLITETEEKVFEACKKWVRYEENEDRKALLPQILAKVRWQLLSPDFIIKEVCKDDLIQSSPECHLLTDEAIKRVVEYSSILPYSRPRNFGDIGQIYVVGGDRSCKTMEIYNVVTMGWRMGKEMPEIRNGLNGAVLEDKLYILGGDTEDIPSSAVDVYNTKTYEWSSGREMLSAKGYASTTILNGCIYVCGGWTQTRLRTVECYNPIEDIWTNVAPMLQYRSCSAAVSLCGMIYVIGGRNQHAVLNSVECFDHKKNSWKYVSPMKHKRQGLAAVALKGKLYACGGNNGKRILKSMEMYDPIQDKWKNVASMNSERDGLALVSNFGRIWAIGGNSSAGVSSSMEIYDPETNEWRFGFSMFECRRHHVAAVIP